MLDALLAREQTSSTGVGSGVAVPHARLAGLDRMRGVFLRLETPVDFDSVDGAPVDLIFALLAPADAGSEHLRALARFQAQTPGYGDGLADIQRIPRRGCPRSGWCWP